MIHAYYPEILQEIFSPLSEMGLTSHVFVTCTEEDVSNIQNALGHGGIYEAMIETVANRGRDVAPFLRTLARVDALGLPLLLKLHTKRSRHRLDGDVWRADICGKLLSRACSGAALIALREPSSFGIGRGRRAMWCR